MCELSLYSHVFFKELKRREKKTNFWTYSYIKFFWVFFILSLRVSMLDE